MSKRKSASARRTQQAARLAAIKFGFAILVIAAVTTLYFQVSSAQRDLDPTTLCPSEPDALTVLLVDVTDPMNVAQRQDFNNQLERLKNRIPRYGKLTVMRVDAAADKLLTPIITRCNPGRASDMSSLTGDPGYVQKLRDEGFDAALRESFDTITLQSGAAQSPILESIQSAALTELFSSADSTKPRRIVLASDLLQNTPDISFYRQLPSADELVASRAFSRVRTDLRGVEVELWMLQRTDAPLTQPRALPQIWDRLIAEQGGEVVRVYTVSG